MHPQLRPLQTSGLLPSFAQALLSLPPLVLHAAFYGVSCFSNESCSNPAEEGRAGLCDVPVLWMVD